MNYELESKKALIQLAKILNRPIDAETVAFYWAVLMSQQIAPESIYKAIMDLGVTSTRFPSPNDILERIRPSLNLDEEAKVLASNMIAAINCGWNNPDKARTKMGELGWDMVKSMGGWMEFYRVYNDNENSTALYAQLRDLIKAKIGKAKRGHTEALTIEKLLPENQQNVAKIQNLIQGAIKKMDTSDES